MKVGRRALAAMRGGFLNDSRGKWGIRHLTGREAEGFSLCGGAAESRGRVHD